MKNVSIISFILCCCLGFTQPQNNALMQEQTQHTADDTLHWSKDRKLTWDDFKGVPDTTTTGMAGTVSGFITKSEYTSDSTISVVITAVFYKQKSWVKDMYMDSATLNHEQRHFDITEVYARKANVIFREYKFNKETVNADINKIFNFFAEEKDKMQVLYDKETTKPINNKKQKEWDRKIDKWLKDIE